MPAAGRLGDKAQVQGPGDAHGCPACPHPAIGPAIIGSANVNVNHMPALRVGDVGIHAVCCGPNMWTARVGAATVFINGIAAYRQNDMGQSCGGVTKLIEGSPNVNIGDATSGGGGLGNATSGGSDADGSAGQGQNRSSSAASTSTSGSASGSLTRGGGGDPRADSSYRASTSRAPVPWAAGSTPPVKAWIEVAVTDDDGAPLRGMPYRLELPDYTMVEGKLDDRGRVRREQLEPGLARLWVPDVDRDHDPVPPIRPDHDEEKAWIDVTVLGPDGRPAAGKPVKLELPDGTIVDQKLDETGRLFRADLPPGHARLHVPDDDALAFRPPRRPPAEEKPRASLEVLLTDELGRPRPDLPVKLQLPGGQLLDVKTDAGGVLRHEGLDPGAAELHVPDEEDAAGAARAAAAPPQGEEEQAFLEVAVTDDAGRPLADTAVKLELPDGTSVDARTDAQGVVRREGVRPGTARLHVPDSDAGGAGGRAAAGGAAPPPEARATFELVLADDAGRPLAGTPVKLELADGTVLDEKTDESGAIRKEGLPPGAVKVHLPG